MKRLVAFPLEGDGGVVLIEVVEPEPKRGAVPAARPEIPEQARMSFEQALSTLKPAAEVIIGKLRALSNPPDEIGLEFGLKLSAEAGAFVASAGIEANYNVRLTWKRSAANAASEK